MRLGAAAILVMALSACGSSGNQPGGRGGAEPLVRAEVVKLHRFADIINAVGTANANEQVVISSPVTERIERLNFSDGSNVQRGQVIAVLARGQERAGLAQAEARAREAEQQLARLEQLKERGFATNASVDAQAALALANQAGAQQARAAIGDRIIRAPFSGQVSLRTVSPGAVVSAGTPIATIADTSVIKLDFTIPETALSALAEGQDIIATAAARPGQPFEGKIATIEPRVDPVTRAIRVRALLPNRDGALLPGMLMSVVVQTQPRMAMAVPEVSVVGEADRRYIFVLDEENKAKRTEVEIGARDAGLIEIKSGLKEGQRVVGEGLVKVSDGMKVRLEGDERAAAQPGGRAAPQRGGQ